MKRKINLLFSLLVICSILLQPFSIKSYAMDSTEKMEISIGAIPKNGSTETCLLCGSSIEFNVVFLAADGSLLKEDSTNVVWEVSQKDGTDVHAAYTVLNNNRKLRLYAPYGYAENLEIKAYVKDQDNMVATYNIETAENAEMTGSTFFRFDMNTDSENVSISETKEVWNVAEKTYTVTLPTINASNIDAQYFAGWKDSDGVVYSAGEAITMLYKNNETFHTFTAEWTKGNVNVIPSVTPSTGAAVTAAPIVVPTTTPAITVAPSVLPTATPAVTAVPSIAPAITPAITVVPSIVPTTTSAVTVTPSTVPIATPESTATPSAIPESVATPSSIPVTTPDTTSTPIPENVISPTATAEPVSDNTAVTVDRVSKVNVKNIKSRKAKISWKKVLDADGYEVIYSNNKKFTKKVTKTKKITANKTTITLSKLTKKKTYYIKVRAYKVVNNKRVYGRYSTIKKVTIKK